MRRVRSTGWCRSTPPSSEPASTLPGLPERADQIHNRARRGSLGGRPPAVDREIYKQRSFVERCFNRLKQWRGIATRYDKTAESCQATVTLASPLMWA